MKKLIQELEQNPTMSVACAKTGISRQTAYRWKKENPELESQILKAQDMGIEALCDLAENKLFYNINKGNQRAIEYFLGTHKEKYYRPRKPIQPETRKLNPIDSIEFIESDEDDDK